MSDFETEFVESIGRGLLSAGFVRKGDSSDFFVESDCGDIASVRVHLVPEPRREYLRASLQALVRVGELEEVYVEFRPDVDPGERDVHPTLYLNCANIFRNRDACRSYRLTSSAETSALAGLVWTSVVEDVLPLFDRVGNRAGLVKDFESSDPLTWITSDRMTRYCVMLSDRALEGDRVGFEGFAESFLEYCEKPHGRIHLPSAKSVVQGVRNKFF